MALKRCYKKLLQRLLIEDENGVSLIDFLNMKVVMELIAESWGEIKGSTLYKSWRKTMPIQSPKQGEEIRLKDRKMDMKMWRRDTVWMNSDSNNLGFRLMTDDEICGHVLSELVPDQEDKPEPEEGESNVCPVSNSSSYARECLTWLEHQSE